MTKSSNLVFGALLIASFPLKALACGISPYDLKSFFSLFSYLLIPLIFLYSFTLTLRTYITFSKKSIRAPEVLSHSKNISKLFLILIVSSIALWIFIQIFTASFCLPPTPSPSELYSAWIIRLAYVVTFFLSLCTYIVSKRLLKKVTITSTLCFFILLITCSIELIPFVAFLRLTVFFPETIPERFIVTIPYQ